MPSIDSYRDKWYSGTNGIISSSTDFVDVSAIAQTQQNKMKENSTGIHWCIMLAINKGLFPTVRHISANDQQRQRAFAVSFLGWSEGRIAVDLSFSFSINLLRKCDNDNHSPLSGPMTKNLTRKRGEAETASGWMKYQSIVCGKGMLTISKSCDSARGHLTLQIREWGVSCIGRTGDKN
jgi:hypothetical protein